MLTRYAIYQLQGISLWKYVRQSKWIIITPYVLQSLYGIAYTQLSATTTSVYLYAYHLTGKF